MLRYTGGLWDILHLGLNRPHDGDDCYLLVGFYLYPRRVYAHHVWLYPRLLCCDHGA